MSDKNVKSFAKGSIESQREIIESCRGVSERDFSAKGKKEQIEDQIKIFESRLEILKARQEVNAEKCEKAYDRWQKCYARHKENEIEIRAVEGSIAYFRSQLADLIASQF